MPKVDQEPLLATQTRDLNMGTHKVTNVGNPTAVQHAATKAYVDAHGMVQVVNTQTGAYATTSTPMVYDDSIPQNDEGVELMTLAITPTSATNKLKIDIVIVCSSSGTSNLVGALFQDDGANAIAAAIVGPPIGYLQGIITFTHYMTAGTTSETIFKVRGGVLTAVTFYFNGSGARKLGGVSASSITITEIKV